MSQEALDPGTNAALSSEQDADGRAILCVGAALTMYFRGGFRQPVRQAVLETVNQYIEWAGPRLKWWFTEGRRYSPVAKLKSRDMSAYFLSPKYEAADSDLKWSFAWHGGEHPEDASNIRVEGLGASRIEVESQDALSYLRVSFPLDIEWQRLVTVALQWCERLSPVHGYGGPTLIQPASEELATLHEGLVVKRASRHPGLEVDSPVDHALWTRSAVKGGNWLTVLSDEFVDRLGGTQRVAAFLGADFEFHLYPGGLLIQAGASPEIGDRNRQLPAPRLARLARLLKPVRVATHPGIRTSSAGYGREAFEQWLARFDET